MSMVSTIGAGHDRAEVTERLTPLLDGRPSAGEVELSGGAGALPAVSPGRACAPQPVGKSVRAYPVAHHHKTESGGAVAWGACR